MLARLKNAAREAGDNYNVIQTRYVGLRFLHRLSRSQHADRFVLKGATLFLVWRGAMHRPTKDIDLLGAVADDEREIETIFREIAQTEVEPDGVLFDTGSIRARSIREDKRYGGIRITLLGYIGSARVPLQIDVGFGDAITPGPKQVQLPTLIQGIATTTMTAYPMETAIAEKLEAMVQLGLSNSRMKDFLDLSVIASTMEIDKAVLSESIRATFARRRTELPVGLPVALTERFWTDETVQTRWLAFVRKNGVLPPNDDLSAVCKRIVALVEPAIEAARQDAAQDRG